MTDTTDLTDRIARCITCGYALTGLERGTCPECGHPFDLAIRQTFTLRPPFRRWAFWQPGVIQAAALGLAATGLLALTGNWGFGLWLGVPMMVGTILGYRLRVHAVLLSLFFFSFFLVMLIGLMAMDLAGIYCGLVLIVIHLPALLLGLAYGIALRLTLKRRNSRFSQKDYLPGLILFALLLGAGALETKFTPPAAPETVTTQQVLNAPIETVWESLHFYEEVTHRPPLILRIGLAHPLATRGRSRAVDDVRTCLYNRGHLTKQITAVDAPHRLAFRVIDQAIGYERDVRLIGGAFELDAINPTTTQIRLTTDYQPLLRPRFAWRWGEKLAIHTLHQHVLRGIGGEAISANPPLHAQTPAVAPAMP